VAALCALDPFDDESPEDKTTREEEEKEEKELKEAEKANWSSCGVEEGVYKKLVVNAFHIFSMETSTFEEPEIQT
jgi:hypothetical protein